MSSDDITKQLPDALREIKQMLIALDSRLAALEDKVDARLVETRPIWERALAEIAETRHEVAALRQEMRDGFDKVADSIAVLRDENFDFKGEMQRVRKRLDHLEGKPHG